MNTPNVQMKDNIERILSVKQSKYMSWPRRHWKVSAVILVLLIIVCRSLFGGGKGELVRYITQPVTKGDFEVTVSATGTLAPIKEVDVGIEVSGTIKTVEVDYNDEVKIGQVLARLDTTRLEAQALEAAAQLEAAQAKLLQAQATVQEAETKWKQLNHVYQLSGGKMPSQTELDTAKATLSRAQADEASAKAAISQAQATLNVNQTDLSKAIIRSPINGVVLERSVEPGQTVAASFQSPTLFTLAEDLTQMELQVDIDEADVGQVEQGQDAVFTVDAYPDQNFPARITQVRYGSQTVDGVVTYKTVLRVDNSKGVLRPGMTATAVITVKKIKNATLIPSAALRFTPPQPKEEDKEKKGSLISSLLPHPPRSKPKEQQNGNHKGHQVWVLNNGELTAVPVTVGLNNGSLTEETSGKLQPGMELVTEVETTSK